MGLIYSNIPELEGSNTEIVLTNLSHTERELESLIERRVANISELAEAILHDGGDPDIIKSIILSIKSDGRADSGNVLDQNRQVADAVFSRYSLVERLTVFKELFVMLGADEPENVSDNHEVLEISNEASERIAYMKNSYNDIVYMQFSALLTSPRAAYYGSASEVCESVYNGECEYCILPIETSGDGKLLSFYELILKYNCKINAVYDLQREGGYTRYALLSKKHSMIGTAQLSKIRNKYIEFIISGNESPALDEIMCAASFCSMKLRRIDTLNISNQKSASFSGICPIFRIDGSDLKTFLTYLSIDCPDINILGIYTQI